MENRPLVQILKPSNTSINLKAWEERLQNKENEVPTYLIKQLNIREKALKQLSKQIKIDSDALLQKKLDVAAKIEKYSGILEQIVTHHQSRHSKPKSIRFNDSISDCQQRVATLLQTIRSTSRKGKQPQKSYFNQSDYEECLFSKRKDEEEYEQAQPEPQRFKSVESTQREYYQNVYQQINKLKL